MDPVTIIVTALVLGTAAGLQTSAAQAVQDAYNGIKAIIQRKYAQVNLGVLEADPQSEARQAVVKEDLAKAQADQDAEVLAKALALLEAIEKHQPQAAAAAGVDLEKVKGASLKIKNILATGAGVRGREIEVTGDIVIEDVRAGQDPKG